MVKIDVWIMPKEGVLDPQGQAVKTALGHLNFQGVRQVRVGKKIELEMDGAQTPALSKDVERMCEKLLANTMTETYDFAIRES